MTEYFDGLRVEKEKNAAVQTNETADGLKGHTPGPWAWRKMGVDWVLWGEHGHRPIVLDAGQCVSNKRRLRVRDSERDLMIPLDPTHPDARLIAAAPDLLAILREALKSVDNDPERYELYGWCNECTQGSTPHSKDKGLCWIHKARKLIGDAQ